MLRLCRLRFDEIGAPDVRLAPLILDFTSEDSPADSLLWMRNGGGKTAILSLFFALLRPDRREFLGALTEAYGTQTRRRLADHVQANDTAHVAAEWELPGPAQRELIGTAPARLVTGMVLEWVGHTRSSDDARLKRGFYSFRATEDFGFDTLPFMSGDGEARRRPSYGRYRELLVDASGRAPGIELVFTDSQREWANHLEHVGLDPDLARYQLGMNRREGAAHELFRFRDDAEFVKFFLEMVVDPAAADDVAETLTSYAGELGKRPELEDEWVFLDAALERMRELAEHAEARTQALGTLREAWRTTARLRDELHAGAIERRDRAAQQRVEAQEHDARALDARRRGEALARQAQAVRLREVELAYEASERALEQAEALKDAAEDRHRAWQAAELLSEERALEATIESLDTQIARRNDELEPLLVELSILAAALLRHLDAQQRDLDDWRVTAERAIEAAEERRRQASKARDRHLASQVRCEQKREQIAEEARGLAAEESSLREAGLLQPSEALAEAQARLEQEAQALERARDERERRAERIREERDSTGQERLRATGELKDREAAHEQLSTRLGDLRKRLDELRSEPFLAELAETETFDLLALAAGFVKRLRELASHDERALVQLEIEGFEDRRALESLDRDGLLPPSRDAERVLEHLATAGVPAVSGTRYLAESVPTEHRRSVLEAHPELAAGVLVTQVDGWPKAREVLSRVRVELDTALVVAAAAALDGWAPVKGVDSDTHRFVLAPSEALFDLDAAAVEREARATSVASLEGRRATLSERRIAREELARRLGVLLTDCPPGHLEVLDCELDDLSAQIAELTGRLDALQRRAVDLDAEDAELRRCAELERRRGAEVARALERIAAVAKRAGDVARMQATLPAIDAELASSLDGLAEAVLESEAAEAERTAGESVRRQVAAALVPMQQRRQEVLRDDFVREDGSRELSQEPIAAGDAAAQWSRYEVCREQYRRATSNDVLRSRRHEKATQLAKVTEKLDADELLGQREAAAALLSEPAAGDSGWRRSRLREADDARTDAIARAGDVQGETRRLRAVLSRLRDEGGDLEPLPDELQPEDAAAARELARGLDEQVAIAHEERSRARKASEEAQRDAELREKDAENLGSQEQRLASALEAQADRIDLEHLASRESVGATLPKPFVGSTTEAQQLVEARDAELRSAARVYEQADRAAKKAAEALQREARAPKHAKLASVVRDRIAMDDPEHLRDAAPQRCLELETRIDEIMKRIEALDQHRDLIVRAMAGIVEEALTLLQGAERSSKLPEGLDAWSGRQFLRIRFERPQRDEELFGRLKGLVDRIVDEASVPRGLPLLLRASLEVVGATGYKVTILKPDALLRTEYFPIAEMGKFSGGQQLTGAILLYCTLARLRAKSRGRPSDEGGVLILDNPIGTCSNVTMLRLQRRVAQAMGIQLVYTTGVNDRDALATLPNIIRLRNDRRDRRTGNLHVGSEGDPEPSVVATRVYRRESGAP